jgi:hypothetical protein
VSGAQGDGDSFGPSLAANGRSVAFTSDAQNLIARDTNNLWDVFVRGPLFTPLASVSGTLVREEVSPDALPQNITFLLRPQAGGGDTSVNLLVESNGAFTVVAPVGRQQMHVKGIRYLAVNADLDTTGGPVGNITLFLNAGDADNDNIVDVSDLHLLIQSFDAERDIHPQYDPGADLNADGLVDVFDLGLLIRHFDQEGDP